MAEDFPAQPQSPQVAYLDGVRSSDAVVLLLGASYGNKQASGLSATHEEFLEARDRRPVFAFMQRGVRPDDKQAAFVAEVRGWVIGLFSPEFGDPADLRNALTKAIHHWQLSTASAPVDTVEVLNRALAAFPTDRNRGSGGPLLQVVVAGGPEQSILRPSRIEDTSFADSLLKTAMFGSERRIFSPREASDTTVRDGKLVLTQGQRLASIDEMATVTVHRSGRRQGWPVRDHRGGSCRSYGARHAICGLAAGRGRCHPQAGACRVRRHRRGWWIPCLADEEGTRGEHELGIDGQELRRRQAVPRPPHSPCPAPRRPEARGVQLGRRHRDAPAAAMEVTVRGSGPRSL